MVVTIIAVAGLALALELVLPWWSIGVAAFVIGAWRGANGKSAFLAGFSGVGLLWLVSAGLLHFKSGGILTGRIAEMLNLPAGLLVLLASAVVGGLVGGMAAATGYHLRALFAARLSNSHNGIQQ